VKRFCCVWVLGGVAAALACPLFAVADEVAQPWGTIHGDIGGRAASNHPSMTFQDQVWIYGADVAWTLDLPANGTARTGFRASIVFDEFGNLYWKSAALSGFSPHVISVDPDGNIRWKGWVDLNSNDTFDAGEEHYLGGSSQESVVVGDGGAEGRVYALGDDGSDGFVVAYSKATGERVWQTSLTGSNFKNTDDGNARLTPVLYGGKLYIVGSWYLITRPFQVFPAKVFVVNTTSGAVEWSTTLPTYDPGGLRQKPKGQMTMVPDAFGTGKHGLYFNDSSGLAEDNVHDMYAIQVDTATQVATLAWSSDGGKVARSHVIHMPAVDETPRDRVCTPTWSDYGGEMYCWDLDGANRNVTNNAANSGHGYYDIGSLEFNGHDIIAGGFEGQIIRYRDIDVNTNGDEGASDVYYQLPDNWWGEPRMIGGLYADTLGNSIVISGTNSRCNCTQYPPGSLGECLGSTGYEARIFAVDVTNGNEAPPPCEDVDDGPIYIDNVVIKAGWSADSLTTVLDVGGFESYPLGDIDSNGNPGGSGTVTWDANYWNSVNGRAQIVDVSGIGGTGKAIWLDAFQGCYTDSMGITAAIPNLNTYPHVVVEWDQYRPDLWDNVFMDEDMTRDGWFALQWDVASATHAVGYDGAVPLVPEKWQRVKYKFNYTTYEVKATVTDDVNSNGALGFVDPFDPNYANLNGWSWNINGTAYTEAEVAITQPFFAFNTGSIDDHSYTVRGGPLLGPTFGSEQHIYYFRPEGDYGVTPLLVAIKGLGELIDCNQNSVPDAQDINSGYSEDCNGNNIPDECEIDKNSTAPGGPFFCEENCNPDINDNGIPDECEDLTGPVVQQATSIKTHGTAPGDSVNIEMDQQINLSPGQEPEYDAIYSSGGGVISFEPDADGWTRMLITGGGWYYMSVNLMLTGDGAISVEGGGTMEFDARYYQDATTNTNPYEDAPIFVTLYSYNEAGQYLGSRTYGIVYQTGPGWQCAPLPQYPSWVHVTIDLGNMLGDYNCDGTPDVSDSGDFDPGRVTLVRFYGTDWFGTGDDYVDIKNLVINTNQHPNLLPINVLTGGESRTGGPTELEIKFDEDIFGVGGLDVADVSVSSGTVTNVAADDDTLTILMNGATPNALLTVGFPGIMDTFGNISPDPITFGVMVGDAQGDFDVDLYDFYLFQRCFAEPAPIGASCASSDFVADGDVDITNDYLLFAPAMTGPNP